MNALWILLLMAIGSAPQPPSYNTAACQQLITVPDPSRSVLDAYRSCRRTYNNVTDEQLEKEEQVLKLAARSKP